MADNTTLEINAEKLQLDKKYINYVIFDHLGAAQQTVTTTQ